jgi:hypothetical protein
MTTIVPAQETFVTIVSQNYPQNKVTVSVDNDLNQIHTVVVENTYFPYIIYFTGNPDLTNKRYISQWLYERLIGAPGIPGEYQFDVGKILHSLDQEYGIYPYYPLNWSEFSASYVEQITKTPDYAGDDVTVNGQTVLEAEGAVLGAFDVTPEYILTWLDFPIKNNNNFPIETFPPLLSYGSRKVESITYGEATFESDEGTYQDDTVIITMGELHTVTDSFAEYNRLISESGLDIPELKKDTIKKLENANKAFSLEEALSKAIAKANDLTGKADSLISKASELSNSAKLLQAKFNELNNFRNSLSSLSKFPIIKLSKIVVDRVVKRKIKKDVVRKPKIKGSRNYPYTVGKVPKQLTTKNDRLNTLAESFPTADDSPITPQTIKFMSDSIDYADQTKAFMFPPNYKGDSAINFAAPGTLVSKMQEKRQKLLLQPYDLNKLPYYAEDIF